MQKHSPLKRMLKDAPGNVVIWSEYPVPSFPDSLLNPESENHGCQPVLRWSPRPPSPVPQIEYAQLPGEYLSAAYRGEDT